MNHLYSAVFLAGLISVMPLSASTQEGPMKGMDMPLPDHHKITLKAVLQPAERASVKILLPEKGQILRGDQVPLQFELVKEKRGEHVHAYADGELMGLFARDTGTLTGIQPGQRTLELRAVAEAQQAGLDASDRGKFVFK